MMNKEQKTQTSILITGCSSGIGLHCAQTLKEKGYLVIASARRPEDVKALQDKGLIACQLDHCDADTMKKAVEFTLEQTGGTLDCLFNNGAYGQIGALEDISTEVLREQFETNFFGQHHLIREVLPTMHKQGYGKIIQHSSVLGLIALRFRGPYNATKFALEGYLDTLRLELFHHNIFVSTLNTGPVTSHFRKNAYKKFHDNVDAENSYYKKAYLKQEQRFQSEKKDIFQLGPESVTDKVIHILESNKPKPRYYITTATWLMVILKRILTTRALDRLLLKM